LRLTTKRIFPRLGILLLALTTGCDVLWNAANRGSLERDFKSLAQSCGVRVTLTRCRMLGTTRDGACEFTTSRGQIDSLVRGLNLKPVEPGSEEEASLKRIESSSPYSWSAAAGSDPSSLVHFASGRRPRELVLKNGAAFEYLILFYDPGSGRALARLSYAYG
jgi:hypothetical protein